MNYITASEAISPHMTITVEEAGAVLGLKRTAAYDAVRRGQIPALRLGRRIRIPVPALIRLLETGGTADPHRQVTGQDGHP